MDTMPQKHPENLIFASAPAGMVFAAEEEGQPVKLPTFTMTAYAGGKMDVGYFLPVVMDIAGMNSLNGAIPALMNHKADEIAGHIDSVLTDGESLKASGVMSGTSQEALDMVSTAKNGFPWQASIGAKVHSFEEMTADAEPITVNRQQITGPCLIARQWTLKEVSIVSIGADANTSTQISAKQPSHKENIMPADAPKTVEAAAPVDVIAKAAADFARIAEIEAAAEGHASIKASALKNGWSVEKVQLEVLKASAPKAPATFTANGGSNEDRAQVVEAALLMASGMGQAKVGKFFSEKVMNEAVSAKNRGYSLGRLACEVAASAGEHVAGGRLNEESIRAAFRADVQIQASGSGWSTVTLSGLLGNVANKTMLAAYNTASDPWREIVKISSRSDFKTSASYRMNLSGGYSLVPPSGELKSAKLSESKFDGATIDTYGVMLSLNRQMLINDDLGAFAHLPAELGRKAALGVRDAVYKALFNAPAGFYTAANQLTGVGSALSTTSLDQAEQLLAAQADASGVNIGLTGKNLLVGPSNSATARQIYVSTNLIGGTTPSLAGNIFAGKYNPLVSNLIAGTNATNWFLLPDPMEAAAIEVAFLNGNEAPIIESAQTDFATLGMQWRMYHDFGVGHLDPKAIVRAIGA